MIWLVAVSSVLSLSGDSSPFLPKGSGVCRAGGFELCSSLLFFFFFFFLFSFLTLLCSGRAKQLLHCCDPARRLWCWRTLKLRRFVPYNMYTLHCILASLMWLWDFVFSPLEHIFHFRRGAQVLLFCLDDSWELSLTSKAVFWQPACSLTTTGWEFW